MNRPALMLVLALALPLPLALTALAQGTAPETPPAAASPPRALASPVPPIAAPVGPPAAAPAPPAPPAPVPSSRAPAPTAAPTAAPGTAPVGPPATTGPAGLSPPGFDCIGAEQIEDDAFAIPFARGAATLAPATDGALEALFARANAEPTRPLCILGHAGPQEGGATANTRLAARRAAAVADDLARRGLPRDRLRAEVRVAAFARAAAIPAGRSVTVVLLPAP
jgi:outer membrane protein OmpA-like peptidoglycan-associated protein